MQPLWRTHFRTVLVTRLYLDDLERILNVLDQEFETLIRTDLYPQITLEQLEEYYDRPIRNLAVEAQSEHGQIIVSFSKKPDSSSSTPETKIETRNRENLIVRGTEEQVVDILRQCRHPFLYAVPAGVAIGLLGSALLALGVYLNASDFYQNAALVLLLSGILLGVLAIIIIESVSATIHPRRRSREPNFFVRHKDDLIKLVFAALLGGIVTYVLTLLTGS